MVTSLKKGETHSMVKKLNGYLLQKRWDINILSKFDHFKVIKSGLVLGLRPDKSNHIKLHAGTYYLQNEKTFKQTGKSVVELVISLKSDGNSIIVSGVIPIFDNINNKVNKINHHVALMCWQRNISFISHSEASFCGKIFSIFEKFNWF